ncbi:hypothetical protein C8J57DRAFT_1223859 [Mycena rebaudengoi]|nr:hypothetical protein C8J57DRAFT_1223859 [Mycena rebaudengoi]
MQEQHADSVNSVNRVVDHPIQRFKWARGDLIRQGTRERTYLAMNPANGEIMAVKQMASARGLPAAGSRGSRFFIVTSRQFGTHKSEPSVLPVQIIILRRWRRRFHGVRSGFELLFNFGVYASIVMTLGIKDPASTRKTSELRIRETFIPLDNNLKVHNLKPGETTAAGQNDIEPSSHESTEANSHNRVIIRKDPLVELAALNQLQQSNIDVVGLAICCRFCIKPSAAAKQRDARLK